METSSAYWQYATLSIVTQAAIFCLAQSQVCDRQRKFYTGRPRLRDRLTLRFQLVDQLKALAQMLDRQMRGLFVKELDPALITKVFRTITVVNNVAKLSEFLLHAKVHFLPKIEMFPRGPTPDVRKAD